MPVLGMMSVFDWSEADNVKGGWTGREWFVVNKAWLLVRQRLAGSAKSKVGSIRFNDLLLHCDCSHRGHLPTPSDTQCGCAIPGQAEVKLAGDNTLIPSVKMGVEARTQVCRDGGLEDSAITSKNHPLRTPCFLHLLFACFAMFCLWLIATPSFS